LRVTDRRTFLTTSAAAIIAPYVTSPLSRRARPERSEGERGNAPLKLGVASYSLRNFPRAKAIEMVQALGTPFINLKSVHLPYELPPGELAAGRREIEAAGLQIVGGGTITFGKDTDEDVRRYFDYAKAAGMPATTAS